MKITFSPNFFINLPFVFSGLSTAADCEHMYSVLNVNPKPVNSGKKANGTGDGKEVRFFFYCCKKNLGRWDILCSAFFWLSIISYISPSLLQALTCLFEQESSSLTEEETLSRSTLGQDREPDKQPGAHGERSANCTDTQQRVGGAHSSSLCSSFQVQDLEFAQIERKVIDGLKVGNECLKKMHEVGDDMWPADAFKIHHLLFMSCYQLFFAAGDVYWRSRTDYGWNSRCHWVPKGRSFQLVIGFIYYFSLFDSILQVDVERVKI